MASLKKDFAEPTESKPNCDLEKNIRDAQVHSIQGDIASLHKIPWFQRLATLGVEIRGVDPVPLEERTDKSAVNLFTLWFTANLTLLPVATGISGPLSFGLSLRDSSLIILFFGLLSCVPVAWMGMLGPRTGMRQMIQARYYFGYYPVTIVVLLQLASITGFTIISAIVSGQTISAVSGGSLTLTIGIIITAVVGLAVSFMGYKVLHLYERYSWIPALIAVVVTVSFGGKYLHLQAATEAPTASNIISFGAIVASFLIAWCPLVSDFSVYISPEVPKTQLFLAVYTGAAIPSIPLLVLGAAIGGAVPNVPSWATSNDAYSTGGVVFAMLSSGGGFGKFIAVILAFSVIGVVSCSLYALSVNFQVLLPIFVRVPRYVFSILITAIIIPVSIVVASNFYGSLNNFLGLIGYYVAVFVGISVTEHHLFRKGDPDSYDPNIWNVKSQLPIGVAALGAFILSFGLIIPSMAGVWYTGPIAKHTGDIGFEVGFCFSIVLYIPFRALEKRLVGR